MNRKFLGGQILGHLQLYGNLGVRYVVRTESARSKSGAAAPGRQNSDQKEIRRSYEAVKQQAQTGQMPALPADMSVATGETLEAILNDMANCKRCKLASTRTNLVFGSGNPRTGLMFVGEAPGADEDEQGLPFVGRAGRLLTLIIESIGIRREDVYICNILKCRPPQNRNPEIDEIAACEGFLFRQIAVIRPRVIVALGQFGAQALLRTTETIGKLRGRMMNYRGAKLMATYHPAYLLRSPLEKRKVWEDMRIVRNYLGQPPKTPESRLATETKAEFTQR